MYLNSTSNVDVDDGMFKIPNVPLKRRIIQTSDDRNCENSSKRRRSTRLSLKSNAEPTSDMHLFSETSSLIMERRRSSRVSHRFSIIPPTPEIRKNLKTNAESPSDMHLFCETSSPVSERRRSSRISQRFSIIPPTPEARNKNVKKLQAQW